MKRTLLLFAAASLAAAWAFWPGRAGSHETLTTTVLFDREIVRILDRHCAMCHMEAGPAFPLETYEQTWLRRREMYASVIARHMPPWAAVPGYGEFVNDNSLTLRETQFVVSWVEGLGPRNAGTVFRNIADPGTPRPAPVRAHGNLHAGHWQLGPPDLMLPVPARAVAPGEASGVRRAVIDTGLTTARKVRAMEYMPDDRRVVRAVFFSIEQTGQWIGSWTPWYGFAELPEGAAYTLPAGARIVAEVHYRGTAGPATDSGTLGLFVAGDDTSSAVSDLVLEAQDAGSGPAGRRLHAVVRLAADSRAIALLPELSRDLTSLEVSARTEEGATNILLFAKDIPAEWPTPYIFREPVQLRRGTELSVTAYAAGAPAPSRARLTVSTVRDRP